MADSAFGQAKLVQQSDDFLRRTSSDKGSPDNGSPVGRTSEVSFQEWVGDGLDFVMPTEQVSYMLQRAVWLIEARYRHQHAAMRHSHDVAMLPADSFPASFLCQWEAHSKFGGESH